MSALYKIPAADISAYLNSQSSPSERLSAAASLAEACHEYGCCYVTGHGLTPSTIENAFKLSRRLFDLPLEDKMKAPHPPSAKPHRGYSGVGLEKVYSKDEASTASDGTSLRAITDHKESFEVGSEENAEQSNIWLPEEVLPGFRTAALNLYWEMNNAANRILMALVDGLKLASSEDRVAVTSMNGQHGNQLRLLHYPAVESERLRQNIVARMPAHTDWGGFTMLFQDQVGGLELQHPTSKEWMYAKPMPGALVLNIGDFFERITNGYLKSATHRVTLPAANAESGALAERYSIPYFVAPLPSTVGRCFSKFVNEDQPAAFETMTFEEYGRWREKYSY